MNEIKNQFTTQGFVPTTWEQTPDGFLRVKARTLKEGVMPYCRAELSNIPPELDGVDPIMLLVGMDALSSGETLRSLEGAQVVAPDHIWVTTDNTDAVKGATAGAASVNGPFQEVDLLITDPVAIEGVKSRTIGEISGGYHADCVFGMGEWNGQQFHGKQVGIFYNHVAVIPPGTGRGGFEVRILNSNTPAIFGKAVQAQVLKYESAYKGDKSTPQYAKGIKDLVDNLQKLSDEELQKFINQKEEHQMSVRVKLRNGKFVNTDEEGAAAIESNDAVVTETEAGSGKKLEELMAEVEQLNAQIAELQATAEEGKGELSVYKEKLDALLSDETIEHAAEAMIEETGEADEIIENTIPEDKKEEIKNSLKGLHGSKLRSAVLAACGVKVENMTPEALTGAFKAQHQICNTFKKTTVAGTKLMNAMTPKQTTVNAKANTRTSAERLGLKK